MFAKPARANVFFYNSGTLSAYGTATDGWDEVYNEKKGGGTRDYAVSQVSSGPIRSSGWALRFETRYGDPDPYDLYHSEVWNKDIARRGHTRWFGWSTYIPLGWEFESPENGVITHQVMQYQASSGEDEPASFMSIRGDYWQHVTNYDDPSQSDGRGTNRLNLGPVVRGQWTDWVVQIRFSSSADGFVKVWKYNDPTPKGQYSGRPTCYSNDDPMDLRLGVYGASWSENPPSGTETRARELRHDEVRIGDSTSSFDQVKPR